mgnify:CR=1 FL=1
MTVKVGYKLWLEVEGKSIMGPGRAKLLRAIEKYGSLSAAARQIQISYRHAYMLVQNLNERYGKPIVESRIGGRDGGGMKLTFSGKELLFMFEKFEGLLQTEASKIEKLLDGN